MSERKRLSDEEINAIIEAHEHIIIDKENLDCLTKDCFEALLWYVPRELKGKFGKCLNHSLNTFSENTIRLQREQFEKTIQSRITEFEKKRDKAKENKDMKLAFEITFLLLELEKLKEAIK